jgi:hypothetical protein
MSKSEVRVHQRLRLISLTGPKLLSADSTLEQLLGLRFTSIYESQYIMDILDCKGCIEISFRPVVYRPVGSSTIRRDVYCSKCREDRSNEVEC